MQKQKEKLILWLGLLTLSVGTESKPIFVSAFTNSTFQGPAEKYVLDMNSGIFKYSKLIRPETREGLAIQMPVSDLGFLGTADLLSNDLTLIAVVFLHFIAFLFFIQLLTGREKDENGFKKDIMDWIAKTKAILTDLGLSIKVLLSHAHTRFKLRSNLVVNVKQFLIPVLRSRKSLSISRTS